MFVSCLGPEGEICQCCFVPVWKIIASLEEWKMCHCCLCQKDGGLLGRFRAGAVRLISDLNMYPPELLLERRADVLRSFCLQTFGDLQAGKG